MKKFIILSLMIITPLVLAQEFVIRLDKDWKQSNRRQSREQILEERLKYLEKAVWELQMKVFELQNEKPIQIVEPVRPNQKAYYCEIELFNQRFEAWGPTELEARTKAIADCSKNHFRNSCSRERVKCEANR